MNSIDFLETMLEYYLPGLDVSKLSEKQFIQKLAHVNVIRELEAKDKMGDALKKITGRE